MLIRASLILIALAGPATAACEFRLRVSNAGAHPVTVQTGAAQARSRSGIGPLAAWGPWRTMRNGGWFATRARLQLDPGGSEVDLYRGQIGCGAERQFQVTYVCRGGPRNGSSYRADWSWPGEGGAAQPVPTLGRLGQDC